MSLTKDVPEIESEKLKTTYILNRARAICHYNSLKDKYCLNQMVFDTFNNEF